MEKINAYLRERDTLTALLASAASLIVFAADSPYIELPFLLLFEYFGLLYFTDKPIP